MIVTSIKQQKKDKERYNIFIDGEFAFGLIMEDILYFKIKEGYEISEEKYNYIKDTVLYIKAQDTALKFLGYKMRTEKEVLRKLNDSGYDSDVTDRVIEFLEKYNYLNDLEYSKAYIRQCSKLNPKGRYAVRCKLRELGVKDGIIDKAFIDEELNETQGAQQLLEKKLKGNRKISFKEKRRLQEFLLRRGYSYDIIKEAFLDLEIKIDNSDI